MESYQKQEEDVNTKYNVRSPNATSRITTHDFALQNYVNIRDKENRYFGTFTHDFQWTQTTIRYEDQFDTIYPHFGIYNSAEVTHDSTRIVTVKNAIQWSNFSPFQEVSNKRNFFHIAGGLMHDYAELIYLYTPFNALYVFGRTHIRLFNIMDITGNISYSLVSDYSNNDFSANAGISWAINREKEHKIGLNAHYYRNDPEYIMQHVAVNNFRWINQFSEQNILQFKAFWNYKKYNAAVSYYYLNN
jgi:hypothetical protein